MFEKYRDSAPNWPAYNSTADYNWIKHQSGLPWLKLQIEVPYQDILNEIGNIKQYFVDHRDTYSEHLGWKSFCIHGKSYDSTREDQFYDDDRPHNWTEISQQLMPQTVSFFKQQWPGDQYHRVRIMELAPGGYISLHRDSEVSRLSPINIAITQPKKCAFVFEKNGTIPFTPGSVFWLDVSQLHTVFNDSDEYRYHIIVHQNLYHQKFQEVVVKSYHDMYNN